MESENNEATADAERPSEDESGYDTIVFDCSGWTMMDIVGMEAVKQVGNRFLTIFQYVVTLLWGVAEARGKTQW